MNRVFSDFKLAYRMMKSISIDTKKDTFLYRTTYGRNDTHEYQVRFEDEILDKSSECVLDWYPHMPHDFRDKKPEPGKRIQIISPPEQGVKPFEFTYSDNMYYIDGSTWLYV